MLRGPFRIVSPPLPASLSLRTWLMLCLLKRGGQDPELGLSSGMSPQHANCEYDNKKSLINKTEPMSVVEKLFRQVDTISQVTFIILSQNPSIAPTIYAKGKCQTPEKTEFHMFVNAVWLSIFAFLWNTPCKSMVTITCSCFS